MSRPTSVHINLDALQHNLHRVRELAPNSKVMAMVKADAYGHGLSRVSQVLQDADALGVACIEEAVLIREQNIKTPIVLMEGVFDASELKTVAEHQLQIVIHQASQLDLLKQSQHEHAITVWLKVDTGMHRLGIEPSTLPATWKQLSELSVVQATPKLMTHFSDADEKTSTKTSKQFEYFDQLTAEFKTERSLANSAAILFWPETHADWVRPGIMLYGISPFADSIGKDHELQPVMTVASALMAVKRCQAGEAVGYGSTYVCPETMPIGIIPIGYGDGYPRHAKTGTPVMVNGVTVPLIGRVSMDMISVDLRSKANAKVGDPVILWGPEHPIEHVAAHAGTIPYELVCNITRRQRFA